MFRLRILPLSSTLFVLMVMPFVLAGSGSLAQSSPPTPTKVTNTPTSAPELDQYGGLVALSSPNGGSGFFRVEKFGKRWMFVTPSGHAFWMFSVQNIGDYCFPARSGKYSGGKNQWSVQVRRRLKSWGFNTVGEFGAAEVMFGRNEEMPFLYVFRPVSNALRNSGHYTHEAVKEIYENIPPSVYNGYRGILIDAFDPKYEHYAKAFFDSEYNLGWIPGGSKNPWLIGYSTEDGDEWFGITTGASQDLDVIKPHPGWAVLVSMDPARSPAQPGSYAVQKYGDLTNYSKLALRDFLKTRYGNDLTALNKTWRSSYSSWDHDGGYGVGSGFLDEGGQHPWVASRRPAPTGDWNTLDAMTPVARKDLDDFLGAFTDKIASVAVNAIRAKDSHHLIFSPDAMNLWGFVSRETVLRSAAKWFDALEISYQEGPVFPDERLAAPSQTYDITGKPVFYWMGLTANKDSAMSASGDPYGVDHAATQAARGEKYATYIDHLFNARGSNGDYFSMGIDIWGWEDQGNERANWGLVSPRDNAYDGTEARIAAGKDRWGYPVGGENTDYGDFLDAVRAANLGVYEKLLPSVH